MSAFPQQQVSIPALTARFRQAVWTLGSLAALLLSGCGESSGEAFTRLPVVPVKGQVLIDGQPAKGATVIFHPTVKPDASKGVQAAPQAAVKDDGSFILTTYDTGDGATPGEYSVTIEHRELIKVDGDWKPSPNTLPERFAKAADTPIKVNITGPTELPPFKLQKK